ncbi:putative diphthamide biosynthesis protein 2 [Rosellinia necatrix]|uniref:2-(3-amino-3-carboxypropyl)histidine synthase subunit 2 n=1 Tax=Rosellinia necatrix TaxID=77044 RepID=A0A1W2TSW3_ROSNE|nr:putative diphthamide biosynthesis protein 2 [Rosellinia necatrix]
MLEIGELRNVFRPFAMSADLHAPPVLSTPSEYIFEDPTPPSAFHKENRPNRSDDELFTVYEIARTAVEIHQQKWGRVALQFPDAMLADAPWVVEALNREMSKLEESDCSFPTESIEHGTGALGGASNDAQQISRPKTRLYILADTSYSACCVDEIAAEHASAAAVVHYGRACLSPTARLPVFHVFTRQELNVQDAAESFASQFSDKGTKAVIMADVMFQEHVAPICKLLEDRGYTHVIPTDTIHDPSSTIPNRSIPSLHPASEGEHDYALHEYHLFHISTPPTSLLLTLSSRLASLRIYPTPYSPYTIATPLPDPSATPSMLRRRYALVLRLTTASIIGILVNTLSVKNYMSTISTLREQIAAAGKKSYTIVVGKLNAAKLANFAEIDGWVVVGCWESGLVDQDGLFKPVITPFELTLALQSDENRIWTGEWWGGIEGVKTEANLDTKPTERQGISDEEPLEDIEGGIDDEESEPPVFDLRTGKLVSNSRPMHVAIRNSPAASDSTRPGNNPTEAQTSSSSLVKRTIGEIALVNGVASPGAEFLRSNRTWQGLGSDFIPGEDETSTVVEEGRSGVARGYTVGEVETRS